MAEAYRNALLILPKQSGFQPTVEPTGFQPEVAQLLPCWLVRSVVARDPSGDRRHHWAPSHEMLLCI
jgi:hypothetical protein